MQYLLEEEEYHKLKQKEQWVGAYAREIQRLTKIKHTKTLGDYLKQVISKDTEERKKEEDYLKWN